MIGCKPLIKSEIAKAEENGQVEIPKIDVVMSYNIEPTPDGKLQILGQTNLPDGTRINVRMRGKSVVYDSLSEIRVRDGQFRSAEFSDEKRALQIGQYWVTSTMVLSTMQPPFVREIIGKYGENLSGELVRRYEDSSATIVVGKHFILNSDETVSIIIKPKTVESPDSEP